MMGLEYSLGINNNQIFFFPLGNQQILGKHQPHVTQRCPFIAFTQRPQAFPTKSSSMYGWPEHWPKSQRPSSSVSLGIANPLFL